MRKLTIFQVGLLAILDSFLGAVIGTLSFANGMALTQLVYGKIPKFSFGTLSTIEKLFSHERLLIDLTLPCLLSTLILTPSFIRLIEKEATKPKTKWGFWISSLYGIVFGIAATFLTSVLVVLLGNCRSSDPVSGLMIVALILFTLLASPAFVFWCFPFIMIGGVIFGALNLLFVKLLLRTPPK